jgi:hypothetical protein
LVEKQKSVITLQCFHQGFGDTSLYPSLRFFNDNAASFRRGMIKLILKYRGGPEYDWGDRPHRAASLSGHQDRGWNDYAGMNLLFGLLQELLAADNWHLFCWDF